MLDSIVESSIRNRWLVLLAVAAMAAFGVYNYHACRSTRCRTSPTCRCRSTPRRRAIRRSRPSSGSPSRSRPRWPGCRGLDYTRSLSRYGLSQVTVVFKDGTDIYFARQRVGERLQEARVAVAAGPRARAGPDRDRPGRDLHVDVLSVEHGATKPDGEPYDTDRPAHHAGLGRAAAAAQRARRHRGQHDRRLRAADTWSRPDPARLLAYGLTLARRGRRARAQQRERRRRLHRAERRAVPRPRAGPGRDARAICARSCVDARDGAPIRVRDVAEVGDRPGTAHRRGHR